MLVTAADFLATVAASPSLPLPLLSLLSPLAWEVNRRCQHRRTKEAALYLYASADGGNIGSERVCSAPPTCFTTLRQESAKLPFFSFFFFLGKQRRVERQGSICVQVEDVADRKKADHREAQVKRVCSLGHLGEHNLNETARQRRQPLEACGMFCLQWS